MKWIEMINKTDRNLAIELKTNINKVKTKGIERVDVYIAYAKIIEYPIGEVRTNDKCNTEYGWVINPHLVQVINEIIRMAKYGGATKRNL